MALNSSTISAAMAKGDKSFVVASATGYAAGSLVLMDNEWMQVTKDYASGTTIPVTRGLDGSVQAAHSSGANVVVGLASDFPRSDALRGRPEIGYGPTVGGSVTQATNRTTGVTLHTLCGKITTNNASLAAEAAAEFTVTNAFVAIDDTVVLCQRSGSNGGNTDVFVSGVIDGGFKIKVANNNAAAGTAETGAIILNFAVVKATSS